MLKPKNDCMNSFLKDIKYDEEKGEIQIACDDWILMSSSTLRDLVKGTERCLGTGAIVVWLEAGKHAGREFSGRLVRLGIDFKELPEMLMEFFSEGGWGKIQGAVDFTKKEAIVTIKNSATARETTAKEPVCHFVRGFIGGVCDVMFHDFTECFETKCTAKGDEYCEFHVKKQGEC